MLSLSEWSIFHFQGWSLLIEAIDPKTSCLDWLLGGNAGIMGICACVCVCVCVCKREGEGERECASVEGGKAGISLMKSYRKSMSYWKEKNALPRGGCTQARLHTNTHTCLTMRQSVMCYEQKRQKAWCWKMSRWNVKFKYYANEKERQQQAVWAFGYFHKSPALFV